jgi:hypothetical protein
MNVELSPVWYLEESGRVFFVLRDFRTQYNYTKSIERVPREKV